MSKYTLLLKIVALFVLSLAITTAAQRPNFPDRMPLVERPFSDDEDKFSFAIIGDKTGGGLDKWPVFDRAIDEINALKPDFAIMVGDLIQGYTDDVEQIKAEWLEFWQHESDLTVSFLPLPGNHDITNRTMYDYWVDNIGRTYAAFVYKNCLFVMLNTEEWHGFPQAKGDVQTNWFGAAQLRYVAEKLAEHTDVRHTFVLLHKPAWLYEDSGWTHIETALGEREYTVFAGHFHNLTLHTRNDRRYFVLGATGGGFTPQEATEAGAFDHYSIVTVDNAEVNIAIIEPGNIYPPDIATAEFKQQIGNLVTFQSHFNINREEPVSSGNLDIALENMLEKLVTVDIAFHPSENWHISPSKLTFDIRPGQSTKGGVAFSVPSDALTPFPVYDYSILYGGEELARRRNLIHPIDVSDMHALKNWMLLGPFDLGVTAAPANPNEVPPNFLSTVPMKSGAVVDKTYQGQTGEIAWQEHRSETERLNLDNAFGNPEWAFGYGVTHIKSPDARHVFAQIGWGCNLGRLFLNGVEIPAASVPGTHLFSGWAHFELPLKAGWNTLTIQTGDYTGGWDYRMEVANPTNALSFSHRLPK